MNTLSVRRHPRSLFPEFSELFAGFPPLAGLRPVLDTHVMRLEDEMKDGRYVVRAETPGVDPREGHRHHGARRTTDHQGRA